MNWPPVEPSFIGFTLMLTLLPGANVEGRQPLRESEFGLPPSMLHSSCLPPFGTLS